LQNPDLRTSYVLNKCILVFLYSTPLDIRQLGLYSYHFGAVESSLAFRERGIWSEVFLVSSKEKIGRRALNEKGGRKDCAGLGIRFKSGEDYAERMNTGPDDDRR
jgi:hypothetical protein